MDARQALASLLGVQEAPLKVVGAEKHCHLAWSGGMSICSASINLLHDAATVMSNQCFC